MGILIGDKESYNDEYFSETKKQKAIRLAYGEHWEQVKDYVDEKGWLNKIVFKIKELRYEDLNTSCLHRNGFCLPDKLQGIENNNGWISLKESGLPNDDSYYFVNIDNHISIKQFHIIQYKWWNEYVTHYQPIQKPKNPIF